LTHSSATECEKNGNRGKQLDKNHPNAKGGKSKQNFLQPGYAPRWRHNDQRKGGGTYLGPEDQQKITQKRGQIVKLRKKKERREGGWEKIKSQNNALWSSRDSRQEDDTYPKRPDVTLQRHHEERKNRAKWERSQRSQ